MTDGEPRMRKRNRRRAQEADRRRMPKHGRSTITTQLELEQRFRRRTEEERGQRPNI